MILAEFFKPYERPLSKCFICLLPQQDHGDADHEFVR